LLSSWTTQKAIETKRGKKKIEKTRSRQARKKKAVAEPGAREGKDVLHAATMKTREKTKKPILK